MPENTTARSTSLLLAGVLVIALAAVFLAGSSLSDSDAAPATTTVNTAADPTGIVTSGEGSASGTPDQLTFNASVTNTRPTTAEALAATNHDIRAVTIAARKAGVARKDIKTAGLAIRPDYDHSGGGRRITGYTSTQQVRILVRKLDKAGETLGDVTTAAGNAVSIGGIQLSISNQDQLVAKARTQAVKRSKAAATALAEAAGRSVGQLLYVEEVEPRRYYGDNGLDAAVSEKLSFQRALSVPITPGQQKLSVNVKVRWSLA